MPLSKPYDHKGLWDVKSLQYTIPEYAKIFSYHRPSKKEVRWLVLLKDSNQIAETFFRTLLGRITMIFQTDSLETCIAFVEPLGVEYEIYLLRPTNPYIFPRFLSVSNNLHSEK